MKTKQEIEKISKDIPKQLGRIDVRKCSVIFDPEHIGGIRIRQALHPEFLNHLRSEILELDEKKLLVKAPEKFKRATQNFYGLYVGSADGNRDITLEDLPITRRLSEIYTYEIYNLMGPLGPYRLTHANSNGNSATKKSEHDVLVNSVGIHKYPAIGGEITYHKDPNECVGLVGIFSVQGRIKFSLAASRDGHGEIPYILEPGDLFLMRATMHLLNNTYHMGPFHKVESMGEDRYSVTFRNTNGTDGH